VTRCFSIIGQMAPEEKARSSTWSRALNPTSGRIYLRRIRKSPGALGFWHRQDRDCPKFQNIELLRNATLLAKTDGRPDHRHIPPRSSGRSCCSCRACAQNEEGAPPPRRKGDRVPRSRKGLSRQDDLGSCPMAAAKGLIRTGARALYRTEADHVDEPSSGPFECRGDRRYVVWIRDT